MSVFLLNRTTLPIFCYIPYRCSLLRLTVHFLGLRTNACLTYSTCSSVTDGLPALFLLHTHHVSWNCAYHLRMELSDGGCFPNFVRNCRWTIVPDRHSWNVSTQKAFSLPFAAMLINCAPSGEMHNYCTPHIIKEKFENFLIHPCNYILLSQVYCVWQVVNTPTIISNNPVPTRQECSCQHASVLRHTYTACLVKCCCSFWNAHVSVTQTAFAIVGATKTQTQTD